MSSRAAHPDLWRTIDKLIRDHGAAPQLRKIKAHRSRTAAAGDGQEELTDWHGNALADAAAKSLSRRRLQTDARDVTLQEASDLAVVVLTCVAQGACLAMARWPEVIPAKGMKRKGSSRTRAQDHDDTADDRHIIRRNSAGHFECATCRKVAYSAAGARRLGQSVCGGALQGTIHQSHRLFSSHGVVWCRVCGAFASRWPRQLVNQCTGRPRSQAQRNVLRRLTSGLTPTTAAYLAEVATAGGKPATNTDQIVSVSRSFGHGHAASEGDDAVSNHHPSQPLHEHQACDRPVRPRADASHPVAPRGRPDGFDEDHGLNRGNDVSAPLISSHCYPRLQERRRRERDQFSPSAGQSTRVVTDQPTSPRRDTVARRIHSSSDDERVCTARCPAAGQWSNHLAVGGPRHLTRCTACDGATRLRCRQCLRGLCIVCAKAGRPCAPVEDALPPRRRLRGKQAAASGLAEARSSSQPHAAQSEHRHFVRLHKRHSSTDSRGGEHHHHLHHHDADASPSWRTGGVAPAASSAPANGRLGPHSLSSFSVHHCHHHVVDVTPEGHPGAVSGHDEQPVIPPASNFNVAPKPSPNFTEQHMGGIPREQGTVESHLSLSDSTAVTVSCLPVTCDSPMP